MRVRGKKAGISAHAITGTYVVLFGFDATPAKRKGLLGFAIERTDPKEKQQYWLKGFRTFQDTDPNPAPGTLVTTLEHSVQGFLWGDYTAKPNRSYTYKIVPVYGKPKALKMGPAIELAVKTEPVDKGPHAVYFNRGVAGSQAYARKFSNKPPDQVPGREAYVWLSRGLEEAMIGFIELAKDKTYELRAAVYEFSWPRVLDAFHAAGKRCGDLKIIYDARPGKSHPVETSDKYIEAAKLRPWMVPRTANPSYIAHNKFIVLLKGGKPVQVWTGSTNITEGGLFGQSNVGHIVRDRNIARQYLDYWDRLAQDPGATELRAANVEATPDPEEFPPEGGMTAIFSPRTSLSVLNSYAEGMKKATSTVFFTAAFGVNKALAGILAEDYGFLRYVLLETPGKTYGDIVKNRQNQVSIGSFLKNDVLYRWLKEALAKKSSGQDMNTHVKYIHTKYLLIDPLSDDPVVVTGSANFSDASTTNNDENMLVIRGDKRVADIYLGEFMRMFDHFKFREIASRYAAASDTKEHQSAYLTPDDSWTNDYYEAGSVKSMRRLLFA
jgi:phosphatidylserine/phosphatidylglycerophosphate/cardiolipin synthase-like enzyme